MKPTILTIDDDPVVRKLIRKAVEDLGYDSVEMENGIKGMQFLKNHIPQLILLDVMMPEVDGLQVLEKIKETEEWASIPVILFTAVSQQEKVMHAIQLGVIDYVVKPFRLKVIQKKIQDALFNGRNIDSPQYQSEEPTYSLKLPKTIGLFIENNYTNKRFYKVIKEHGISVLNISELSEIKDTFSNQKPDLIIVDKDNDRLSPRAVKKEINLLGLKSPVIQIIDQSINLFNLIPREMPPKDLISKLSRFWQMYINDQVVMYKVLPGEKHLYRTLFMINDKSIYRQIKESLSEQYATNHTDNFRDLIQYIAGWDPDFVVLEHSQVKQDALDTINRCKRILGQGDYEFHLLVHGDDELGIPEELVNEVATIIYLKEFDNQEVIDGKFGINNIQYYEENEAVMVRVKSVKNINAAREMLYCISKYLKKGTETYFIDFSMIDKMNYSFLEYIANMIGHRDIYNITIYFVADSPHVRKSLQSYEETKDVKNFDSIQEAKVYSL